MMDFEFDKEIDTLLRLTAQGEPAFAGQTADSKNQNINHLDADELAAFAENALPEKAQSLYLRHLADCDACRRNLSELIRWNAEQTNEIVAVKEANFVQMPIAWYRRLFAFPVPAYAMGALVLAFSGIVAYTVLRNVGSPPNSEVSQTSERQTGGRGMSSDGDAVLNESYSANTAAASNIISANAAWMNSSSNSAANSPAMPSAFGSAANSNAAVSRSNNNAADKDFNVVTKSAMPRKEPRESILAEDFDTADRVLIEKEADLQTDGARQGQQQQQPPPQSSIAQNQADIESAAGSVRRVPMPKTRAENKDKKSQDSTRNDEASSIAASVVGGKTFKRTGNVWYDAAYRGQATKNVTRGTNDYQKLDAGLRGIAENLGGTVVVVWKSKAYRIQ